MDKGTRQLYDMIKLEYNIDLSKQRLEKITFDFANRLTLIKTQKSAEIRLRDGIDSDLLAYLLYNVMGALNLIELLKKLELETLPLMLHFDKFESSRFVMMPNHYGILSLDKTMRMGNCLNVKLIPFLPSQLAN
jgi:hypothetical protein